MKRPQSLGSRWKGEKYIHGPRIRQPKEFKQIYTVPVAWAKKRLHKLPRKPLHAVKVKVGALKKSGDLAVQSYLTPVRRSIVRSSLGSMFIRKKHFRRRK